MIDAPKPDRPIRLYTYFISGHSHRVELFLSLLGLPFEKREIDLVRGDNKTAEFLAMNPLGQVPVIQDGDVTIFDSNAILVYLAQRHDPSGRWLPRDPLGAARVQQWLSLAAGQLAFGPARARANAIFQRPAEPHCQDIGARLFVHMDTHLSRQEFLAAATPTIADVALYSYTAHAPEGDIPLEPYPRLRSWLARVEALPGFVDIPREPASA
jgi:glutathione S-transferase